MMTSASASTNKSYQLSVLDLASIWNGQSTAQAMVEALSLAKKVEQLGYTRYWFAEHHGSVHQASSAPELLIAYVAAQTTHLRVGSGGVMLPNHSALKVVESFATLEALYPGRVDLGIGRAPGTDGNTAYALRRSWDKVQTYDFPEQLEELLAFFTGGFPSSHAYSGITPNPVVTTIPDIYMLGSSDGGMKFAANHGLGFTFAAHISPELAVTMLQAYRKNFKPSRFLSEPRSMIAIQVVCAETDEEAEYLAAPMEIQWTRWGTGQFALPFPTLEEAANYRYSPQEEQIRRSNAGRYVIGSAETVATKLRKIADSALAEEIMMMTMLPDPVARQRSYQLVAEAFQLSARS
ncbi:LLM class flavin-dependent oxidoreductase [Paenibacillus agricola]|nr:LLM class flavin-dependent oxidoreductase [Paenibacillus agricola]